MVDWFIILQLLLILLLLCFSGFFSGSETALTAASPPRLHTLEKDGNKRAALVLKLLEHKDRLIGALLLGNNLVNILASALATSVLIKLVGDAGVAYATLIMTLLVLIFAEVLPKTYALLSRERMAMAIAPVIGVVVTVFGPVTEAITWIVGNILRALGVKNPEDAESADRLAELRGAIELHQGPTRETQEQRAMLRSILDLADVPLSDIMTHRKQVTMIDADQDWDALVESVLESPYTRIPVYRGSPDNIIGILHAKALLRALKDRNDSAFSVDALISRAWFVPETTNLYDQLQAFRMRRAHFAAVVDEYGDFMGVVTLEDILEEIVGEIDDETDLKLPTGIRPHPEGGYIVDGQVTIRDLNRQFEWYLPDSDYATIAGLVLHESRTIPAPGQVFVFHNLSIEVLSRQRNQITELRITPLEDDDQQ